MEVRIHLEPECPVPNQTLDLKINLKELECIGDLKKKLQPILKVAACDMTVYYAKQIPRQRLCDKERLSNLYVQEGDTFIIEFVSVCDIHSLSDALDRMKSFVCDVCERFSGEKKVKMDEKYFDLNDINHIYSGVRDAFETCSFKLFIPWNHRPTIANRHYFLQEGGLELLAKIYNFSSRKRLACEDEDDSLYSWLNDKQSQVEMYSLRCLWNLSEMKEDRQLVLTKIGLDAFIYSLLKNPSNDLVSDINEAAVGCLAQYVELSRIQIILADNKEVLLKLLWLISNGTGNYHREVAANTLFCCSCHPMAAAKIIKNQCYRSVLEKAQVLNSARDGRDLGPVTSAVAYFLCLFLANIQTLPEENMLTNKERQNIDQVLETFLRSVSPGEIGEFQQEHSYVWITLSPFIQLALSGPSKPGGPDNEQSSKSGSQFSVDSPSEIDNNCHTMSRNEESFVEGLCNGHRSPYKFSPAEKLGLFCLCHLVTAKENRELLGRENLVDYLICVGWFAHRCPEVAEITPRLESFEHFEPPRLESIAKAYLSKCYGQKIL